MERLALPLMIVGCCLLYAGGDRVRLAWGTSSTPQTIRAADLLRHGSNNRYVDVTDFEMGRQFVAVGKKDWPIKDGYIPIWPATPGAAPEYPERPPPGVPVAIVIAEALTLQVVGPPKSIRGLVTGAGLDAAVRQKLTQQYPGIRLDNILVIEAGRTPPSAGVAWALAGTGAVLLLGPIALIAYASWRTRRPRMDAASTDGPS
jgi:hypothetical protein